MSSTAIYLFIYLFFYFLFQIVCNICFFKSILLADQMTVNCLRWLEKISMVPKQVIFSSNDNKVYTFYYLKIGKIQEWDAKMTLLICIASKDMDTRIFGDLRFKTRKKQNENKDKKWTLFVKNLVMRGLTLHKKWSFPSRIFSVSF